MVEKNGLHVRISGSGPKKVLFLHGFLGSSNDSAFLDGIGTHFTVIAPDLPGHGKSRILATPEEASVEQFPSKLAADLSSFGPFHAVVGYSLGGRIAREMLEKNLISAPKWLFASTFFGYRSKSEARHRLAADKQKAIELLINPPEFFSQFRKKSIFNPALSSAIRSEEVHPPSAALLLEFFSPAHQSRLNSVPENVALALLCGRRDAKFAVHSRAMNLILSPAAYHELDQAWHRVFEDAPEASAAIITSFLKS